MIKITLGILIVFHGIIFGQAQILSRVRVRNHEDYLVDVIGETVREVERRGWSSLKLMDITQNFDEEIIDWHLAGEVIYSNGFVTSIQHVDVLQTSLNQIWSNVGDDTVRVEMRGTLRMTEVCLGFDVVWKRTDDGDHFYTAEMVHPEVRFEFSVFRNVHTRDMSVSVLGVHPLNPNMLTFLPIDTLSDTLKTLFESNSTFYGVTAWATDVFQPIALDVITNSVPFPGLCYNCS